MLFFFTVLEEYLEFKTKFGPVDTLDTRVFFVGPKIAENIDVDFIFRIYKCDL